jgi:hypothetical protein
MSYYGAHESERGILTEQFNSEPTGYSGMGAAVRAPGLRTPMPRASVQPTPQLVGRTVVRRPSRLVIPRSPTQQPAPRPAEYRGFGPNVRPLTPRERLKVTARPTVEPPPEIYLPPPLPPPAPPAPPPSSPPLPDDIEYDDPLDYSEEFDVDAMISEAEGGEALQELEIEAAAAPGAKKDFPWKTVGVVAGVATVLYLIGRS